MEMIERAVARNLLDFVEAAQQVTPVLGAAATACGGGVAAFVGADSPLTTVKGAGPELGARDVNAAETFFRAHGVASAVFELAPWGRLDNSLCHEQNPKLASVAACPRSNGSGGRHRLVCDGCAPHSRSTRPSIYARGTWRCVGARL
jgi:hypothetical protein